MKDDNVYVKTDNGKYKPFGVIYDCNHNYIADGIWYVRHTDHSVGHTNVKYMEGIYKVGDMKPIDIPTLCGLHDYTEYVLSSDEMRNIMNGRYSFSELVGKIVALVVDKNNKYLDDLALENDLKV